MHDCTIAHDPRDRRSHDLDLTTQYTQYALHAYLSLFVTLVHRD